MQKKASVERLFKIYFQTLRDKINYPTVIIDEVILACEKYISQFL